MIGLLAMAAAFQGVGAEATEWDCATSLIEKNWQQRVDVRPLARRIADECASPYAADPSAAPVLEQMQRTVYDANRLNFQLEIANTIQGKRIKRDVPLRH